MTVLHRRARTRPSGPFRSRRAPHSRPVPGLNKRPNCIPEGTRLAASAPMAVKPRPHTLARAADRSSVRTPPPPPPIPGKVRVTPARTGGPSHRYVVGKNKLWFANATRTPPPKPSRRAWNGIATTAFPGRTRAQRPLQSAGTDGAQSAWTGTTVYSVFLSYGAHAEAVHGAAWCKRSAAHCVKHSVTPSVHCTLHTDCCLASGLEKPIMRRRRRPSQLHPRPKGSPPASCAAMWWHTPPPT